MRRAHTLPAAHPPRTAHTLRSPITTLFTGFLVVAVALSLTWLGALPAFAESPDQGAGAGVGIEATSEAEAGSGAEGAASAGGAGGDGAKANETAPELDPADAPLDAEAGIGEVLELSFSELRVSRHGDELWYSTTLSIANISAFYGYQIQIDTEEGDGSVVITSLVGGTVTPPTYKTGSTYQAVLLGSEGLNGSIEVCEITKKYSVAALPADADPLNDDSLAVDRSLVVRKFEAVTSLSGGLMLSLGPDPAAAVLPLSAATVVSSGPLEDSSLWLWLVVAACVLVLIAVVSLIVVRRRRRLREQYARQWRHASGD